MKMRIWKHELEVTDRQIVQLPLGYQILSAQFQGSTLCIWVLADVERDTQPVEIEIIGTGNPMNNANRKFIGTVQHPGRPFVWHVFERI